MGIELNSDQIFAYYEAEKWMKDPCAGQVFEISGAAGTGKTTCIRYILQELGFDVMKDVLFCAYTGKAVTQLSRQGLPAMTCHGAFYNYEKVPVLDEDGHVVRLSSGKIKTKGKMVKKDHLKKSYQVICIDEGSMIPDTMRDDILSFGLPVFVMGDMNQLPPVFGEPVFLQRPNVTLRKLMRQAEDDPIVQMAQWVIHKQPLKYGVYGKSAIIRKKDLNAMQLKNADIILTCTNNLRYHVNDLFRLHYMGYDPEKLPVVGEKVICRKNNWEECIGKNIYLTNGTTGFLDYVERESYNGRRLIVDFRPDFTKKVFRDIPVDYKHLMRKEEEDEDIYRIGLNTFEFAYAITVYSSQGSQWDNVLSMAELYGSADFQAKALYTMITRAAKSQTLVL